MSARLEAFEDLPEGRARGAGIPWYAAVIIVVGLGLVASVVDWALGNGPALATGVAFVLGCFVLGGRVRLEHAVAAYVGAPLCYAVTVAGTAVVQLYGDPTFGMAFRIFWTYALTAGAPWLLAGTAVSCLLVTLRLLRRRRRRRRRR